MTSPRFLSRATDYLGDLGAKLRDLQGYATLAHELIQNADDAPASWLNFIIRTDSLILDNDGVFAGCDHVEGSQCTWIAEGSDGHRCDFHRFRLIGSGDKRQQEGTTGAFGIGFISVYQLTDQPELISSGRRWILREERTEDQRIEECSGCLEYSQPDLPGTRFILPFARNEAAALRRALRAEPVPENVTERLSEELERCIPVAMLFLKNLKVIEVNQDGFSPLEFEREIDKDTLLISQGDSTTDRIWHLLRGNFEEPAQELRRQHPGRIEQKRSADVVVALPLLEWTAGLLCACLPTEESPGLPFHINADFFPSNDRKRVILGHDYQSLWNREALLAAAGIVAENVPRLTEMLGAERFWHLADTLRELARNSANDGQDGVWGAFWEALQVPLRTQAVIPTPSGDWASACGGIALLQNEDEAANIQMLEGLGVRLVSEELRRYQTTLRSIGVPYLDIEALRSALATLGIDKPISFDDLPSSLIADSERHALWAEITILLERQSRTPQAKSVAEGLLRSVSLAPTINKTLWPCHYAVRADMPTVELFLSMGLDIPFLDQTERAFGPLAGLCATFGVKDAVEAIENADPSCIEQLWAEQQFPIRSLIGWFEIRRDEILHDEDIRARVAALPIYPSTNRRLHPLKNLILPGDFEDPFGLTNLVDVDALGGRREFLLDLGARNLSFRAFVHDYLPTLLEDESQNSNVRDAAISLLAKRIRELRDDNEIHELLSAIPIVMCADGECRLANDCYFSNEVVQEVLGQEANIAVLPPEGESPVRELFGWLGAGRTPRLRDVVKTVSRVADGPCGETSVQWVQRIISHLGRRFQEQPIHTQLEALQRIQWLPARGDRSKWYRPNSLHAPYQSYLFESQAAVLDVPPSTNRELLEFLGVHINPSPSLVVQHLLHCAGRKDPVNTEVYRFLNDNADDAAIVKLESEQCLLLGYTYRSTEQVFWSEHPFGQYRWRLSDNLKRYGRLLEVIGVKDTPDYEDAISVLHEISLKFGTGNRQLDDEAYSVLMRCWQMLEEALDTGRIARESIKSLGTVKSIPNKSKILYLPTWLFFENRVGLADKFEAFLVNNVIPRPLKVGGAFQAAGVRQLGSAVEVELVRNDDPADDPGTRALLRQRGKEIARVLSGLLASHDVQIALHRLSSLDCGSATSLVLQYRLSAFNKVVKSQPERVPALYEPTSHCLRTTRQNGMLPWAPIARELAIALRPEEDPGLFAAGLKEVLSAKSTLEASSILDELGFAQLDTTIVEPPVSLEEADELGIALPTYDEGFEWNYEGDGPLSDMGQKEKTEHLTTEDALRALGITQAPTSPIPDPIEPTTSSASERGLISGAKQSGDWATEPAGEVGLNYSNAGSKSSRRETVQATNSKGRMKFVSYVSLSHAGEEEPDPDGLTQQERMNLEERAIKRVLKEEPELKRTPTNNPGFDLFQLGANGHPIKWIEVKAMKGTLNDRPVGISRTQFEWAESHRKAFWLYIVENAGASDHERVVRIQDPVGKSQTFTFDHGWISVAEEVKMPDPPSHS